MSGVNHIRLLFEVLLAEAAMAAGATEEQATEIAIVTLDRHVTESVSLTGFLAMRREARESAQAQCNDDGMCKKPDCPNFGGVWRDCPVVPFPG